MRAAELVLSIAVVIAGCTSTGPTADVPFDAIADLHRLEGYWRNRGYGGDTAHPHYLSDFIWRPGSLGVDAASITTISVEVTQPQTLTVKALSGTETVKESVFVLGRDFEIKEGRIVGKSKVEAEASGEAAALGISSSSIQIGLDAEDQGKVRRTTVGGGLLLGVVPFAGGDNEDTRFARIPVPDPPFVPRPYVIKGHDGSSCLGSAVEIVADNAEHGRQAQRDWLETAYSDHTVVGVTRFGVALANDPVAAARAKIPIGSMSFKDQYDQKVVLLEAVEKTREARKVYVRNDSHIVVDERAKESRERYELVVVSRQGAQRRSETCFEVTSYTAPCCADDPAYYEPDVCERLVLQESSADLYARELKGFIDTRKPRTKLNTDLARLLGLPFLEVDVDRDDPLLDARYERALKLRDTLRTATANKHCAAN